MDAKSLTNRPSLFATKPNHIRIKTQTDCSKQNTFKTEKQFLIKRPLRRYNSGQFDLKSIQRSTNKTALSRKPIAERSLFGQINLHMPKFKKQNTQMIEPSHPLKQYMNGIKRKNIKRFAKKYKTSCDNLVGEQKQFRQRLKILQSNYNKKDQKAQAVNPQQANLFKIIDQIYKKISKFKEVGYTQKKINEWIQNYCLHKRKYMTPLLMKSSNKHKFSQTYMDYFYQKDAQKVKLKLAKVIKKINGKQRPIDQYDLMQFSDYIEQILIQKNKVKILELKDSINQKLDQCFIYNRERNEYQFGKKLHPPDMLNFISDLNEIETKNGRFQDISTFNRQYFMDLGNTQKQIRSKIYELINITQNRTKKFQNNDLQKRFTFDFQKKALNQTSFQPYQILEVNQILQVNQIEQF